MKDTAMLRLAGTWGHRDTLPCTFWGWAPPQGTELKVLGWPQRLGLGPAVSDKATCWGPSIVPPAWAQWGVEGPSLPFGKVLFPSEGF